MEAAGIAPASRFPQAETRNDSYGDAPTSCLHAACTDFALRELVACWHWLSPDVRDLIVRIARGQGDLPPVGG
jgi:hypothetical protein